jgi:LPS-assembly lipoprotein
MIRAVALALALLPLTACNFTPVYGGQGESFAASGPITINEIPGRTGHYLRNELARTVGQGIPGFPKGTLDISLGQGIDRLAFAPDQAASRSDYVGNASWTLRGVDGTVVGSGQVTERASFNFADAAYADMAAQTAAQERLADLLARSIRSEMIIAAGRQKTGEPIKAAPEATIPKPTVPTSTNPTRQ